LDTLQRQIFIGASATPSPNPRISLDPAVLQGKPVIAGTRIAVELVIDLLAPGWTEADILDAFPRLRPGDVAACLAYARQASQLDAVS
jgi:uncharacterized protein (DUF433 family)